jgi:hypothetical protein
MRIMDIDLSLLPADNSEPKNEARHALAAQIMAYLAWPEAKNIREAFLVTPLAQQVTAAGPVVTEAIPSGASRTRIARARLREALILTMAVEAKIRDTEPDSAAELVEAVAAVVEAEAMLFHDASNSEIAPLLARLNYVAGFDDNGPQPLPVALGRRAVHNALVDTRKHWPVAGLRLATFGQMIAHHATVMTGKLAPSLKKADDVLVMRGVSAWALRQAWASHGAIAHIAAAVAALSQARFPGSKLHTPKHALRLDINLQTYPKRVLELAAGFQQLGLSGAHPQSTALEILDPETLWHVPPSITPEPPAGLFTPLTDEELAVAMNRPASR